MGGKNTGTIVGGILTANLITAPIGIALLAADQAKGGDLFGTEPELPDAPDLSAADEAGALAADAERRKRAQKTETNVAGSAGEALNAAIGKTKLGGTE